MAITPSRRATTLSWRPRAWFSRSSKVPKQEEAAPAQDVPGLFYSVLGSRSDGLPFPAQDPDLCHSHRRGLGGEQTLFRIGRDPHRASAHLAAGAELAVLGYARCRAR